MCVHISGYVWLGVYVYVWGFMCIWVGRCRYTHTYGFACTHMCTLDCSEYRPRHYYTDTPPHIRPHTYAPTHTPHRYAPTYTPPHIRPHSYAPRDTPHRYAPTDTPHRYAPTVTPIDTRTRNRATSALNSTLAILSTSHASKLI